MKREVRKIRGKKEERGKGRAPTVPISAQLGCVWDITPSPRIPAQTRPLLRALEHSLLFILFPPSTGTLVQSPLFILRTPQ